MRGNVNHFDAFRGFCILKSCIEHLISPLAPLTIIVERLHAARSLLLLGYQGRMLACLRDVIEFLYYSDVCMKNPQEARRWLDNGYISKDTATEVHQVVERNRKGQMWNLLSGAGVHPRLATRLSSTRYKTSSLGDFRGDPHAVDTKNARRERDYRNTRLNMWVAIWDKPSRIDAYCRSTNAKLARPKWPRFRPKLAP